jgi:hypothetical protein
MRTDRFVSRLYENLISCLSFSFREAGLVTWASGDKLKSRSLWETALSQTKFDFEYRLAIVSSRFFVITHTAASSHRSLMFITVFTAPESSNFAS